MKTNFFHPKRFAALFRLTWTGVRKSYFRNLLISYAIMAVGGGIYTLHNALHARAVMSKCHLPGFRVEWDTIARQIAQGIDGSWDKVFWIIGLIAVLSVVDSSIFMRDFRTRQNGIRLLTLPVTRFETLLTQFIYAVPFVYVGLAAALIAADYTRVTVCNAVVRDLHYAFPLLSHPKMSGDNIHLAIWLSFCALAFVQSLSISLHETKNAMTYILTGLMALLIAPAFSISIYIMGKTTHCNLNGLPFMAVWCLFFLTLACLNGVLAYRRMGKTDLTYCKQAKE